MSSFEVIIDAFKRFLVNKTCLQFADAETRQHQQELSDERQLHDAFAWLNFLLTFSQPARGLFIGWGIFVCNITIFSNSFYQLSLLSSFPKGHEVNKRPLEMSWLKKSLKKPELKLTDLVQTDFFRTCVWKFPTKYIFHWGKIWIILCFCEHVNCLDVIHTTSQKLI